MLPPKLLQGLKNATAEQLGKVELTPLGTGLHWESLDADLSVAGLAAGIFGSKTWMSGTGAPCRIAYFCAQGIQLTA